MSIPSYPFHSLSLKLSNNKMNFSFSPLKLPNKGREKYSKNIIFISFHSIPFPPPKQGLRDNVRAQKWPMATLRIVILGISGPTQLIYKRAGLLSQL